MQSARVLLQSVGVFLPGPRREPCELLENIDRGVVRKGWSQELGVRHAVAVSQLAKHPYGLIDVLPSALKREEDREGAEKVVEVEELVEVEEVEELVEMEEVEELVEVEEVEVLNCFQGRLHLAMMR